MTTTGPRLPPRPVSDDPRLEEIYSRGMRTGEGEVLNIFATLAHHPDLLRRWLVFATHVLSKNTLSPRDRELLILRTGWNCGSKYEWGQHVLIARRSDIDDDEIERVKAGPDDPAWSDDDRTLLQAADDLHDRSMISDDTWRALAARYSNEQLLDVVATVGNYHLVAMFLNSAGVELDPGVPDDDVPGRHLAPPH